MVKLKSYIPNLLLFFYFTILTIFATYPFILILSNSIFFGYSSSTVNLWILDSIFHSLTTDPSNFFNANIFYPLDHTRVFGDISIFTALIYGIFQLIFCNPIFSYNLLLFLSFPFTGITTYYLIKYNTKDNLSSLALSTFLTFCLSRMMYFCHIQIINFSLIPLIILYWQKFLDKGKWQYFLVSTICLLLQFYTGYYNFSFVVLFLVIMLIIYNLKIIMKIFQTKEWWKILIISLSIIFLLLPTAIVIYKTGKQYGMQREYITGYEIQHYFGSSPHSLLYSNLLPRWRPDDQTRGNEGNFNGFLIYFLFVISLYFILKKNSNNRKLILTFLILASCAFLLSLGPDIYFFKKRICSGPYKYFKYFPLLMGIRAPFRLAQFFALFICICGAFGLAELFRSIKLKQSLKVPLTIIIIAIFLLENNVHIKYAFSRIPYNESIPQYYQVVKNISDGKAIIELPYFFPGNDQRIHSKREYFSIFHKKNIVGGFSGFIPSYITELSGEAIFFPDTRLLSFLIAHNINYVILNKSDYSKGVSEFYTDKNLKNTIEKFSRMNEFEKYYEDNEACIYKLKNTNLNVKTNDLDIINNLVFDFNFPEIIKSSTHFIWSVSIKNKSNDYLVPKPILLNKKYFIKLDWLKENTIYASNTYKGYLKHKNLGNIFWLNREMWFPLLLEPNELNIKQFISKTPQENGLFSVRITGNIADYQINQTKSILINPNIKYSLEQSKEKFLIEYLDYKVPTVMKKDTLYQVILTVKNISNYNLCNVIPLGTGIKIDNPKGLVRVCGIWYQNDKEILDKNIVFNFLRNNLICDVSPNQIVDLPLIIHTPKIEGEYKLKLILVNELISWGDNKPSTPPVITVKIED